MGTLPSLTNLDTSLSMAEQSQSRNPHGHAGTEVAEIIDETLQCGSKAEFDAYMRRLERQYLDDAHLPAKAFAMPTAAPVRAAALDSANTTMSSSFSAVSLFPRTLSGFNQGGMPPLSRGPLSIASGQFSTSRTDLSFSTTMTQQRRVPVYIPTHRAGESRRSAPRDHSAETNEFERASGDFGRPILQQEELARIETDSDQ